MQSQYKGRAWKFGDGISTDLLVPGSLVLARAGISAEEAASYCMHANRPDWSGQVRPGDILVAGRNFGRGSSRNGSTPLLTLGISCVLAESIAGIHLRNAINSGLPTLACPGIVEFVDEGEELDVDVVTGSVQNCSRGTVIQADAWPENSPPYEILMAGGFDNFMRAKIATRRGGTDV